MTDINAVARRVQYTGNNPADAGPFAFTFQVNETTEVNVFVDGTLKTISTHYTVSLSSSGAGSVSFTSGNFPTNSQTITISSNVGLARSSVYTTGGPLTAAALEKDFDTQQMILQQVSQKVDRAIAAPENDATSIDMELPVKADRLGKYLAFNSTTGNPEVGPSTSDVTTLASVTSDIATLADIEDGTDATDAIQAVAAIASNVTTVAGVASNVTTVAGIASDVTSVANDATDIGAVAGKATEIGRLGTSASVTSLGLLGTSDAVSDMNTLAAISSNITSVANVSSLITSDFVSDLNTLATSDVVSDLNTLATSDIVSDLNTLATSDIVSDMNTLATSDIVADLNKLATDDIVSDLNTLATTDIVNDLNTLATSDIVTDLNLLATSAIVEDLNLLATSSVIADMATLAGSGANPNITSVTTSGDIVIGGLLKMPDVTSGKILVGDGTSYQEVAVSGDVTIASSGAVTIASDAVEQSMIADDAVGADQLAASAVVTASIVDDAVTQAKIADDAIGADQLAANAVVNASVASSAAIADSKLDTISTANKVSLAALDIDGGTDIGEAIADSDLFIIDNGAGGTNRKVEASRIKTYSAGSSASKGFAIAMAIVFG